MVQYLKSVWDAIRLGLGMQPHMVEQVDAYANPGWVIFGVVMLAGISLLLGQSALLFLYRVRPSRFVLSLFVHGLMLAVGSLLWAAVIWGVGNTLFAVDPPYGTVIRLVGLSYAPLVFGFLSFMPYAGTFLGRLLYVWSFLIALHGVMETYQVNLAAALICAGIGWWVFIVLASTLGHPLTVLHNRLWLWVTATEMQAPPPLLFQEWRPYDVVVQRKGDER
jgi:hypothetical protein